MNKNMRNPEQGNEASTTTSGHGSTSNHGENANLNPQDELTQAQQQRDDYFEQLQRSRAEFANYQKRSKAQADADRNYAVGSLARDLLDGFDNLERAIEALRAKGQPGISDGLEMVHKQLIATLAKHGVEPIHASGQPFDPNHHEAITQQPSDEHPEGTVLLELSKGFKILDRVLRPSKVAVSVKPKPGS